MKLLHDRENDVSYVYEKIELDRGGGMKNRHSVWVVLLLLVLCVCLLSCKGKVESRSGKSTFTIYEAGDKWILGPGWDDDPKFLVFLPLIKRDPETGIMKGCLAQKWEYSEDGRELTIYLRQDVKWHDGVPVTAGDIKFTLELLSHPEVLGYGAGKIESIKILDDYSLKIVLKKRYGIKLDTWQVYYPQHLLEHLDPMDIFKWEFWTHPVGNGPYRFVNLLPKTMMEFEANPDYYLGKPRIERVIIKLSGGTVITELLSGNVDMSWVMAEDAFTLAKDSRFRVYHRWEGGRTQILWNQNSKFFRESIVRRALTQAIDRHTLHKILNFPENLPITDGIRSLHQLRSGKFGEALPFDPDKARLLLREAGWRDSDGDGILDRDGESFSFTLKATELDLNLLVFLQAQFKKIGVRMEIQTLGYSIAMNQLRTGNFEAFLSRVVMRGNFVGKNSIMGYKNPRVVELLDSLRFNIWEQKEIDNIYDELSEIFVSDMPMTYLYPRFFFYAAHRRIRGIKSPFRTNPLYHVENFWIEEEKY